MGRAERSRLLASLKTVSNCHYLFCSYQDAITNMYLFYAFAINKLKSLKVKDVTHLFISWNTEQVNDFFIEIEKYLVCLAESNEIKLKFKYDG